ncbi:MAG: hypothetical protein L3J08_08050 [Flavobacteriaceae bacterium]|nr:hypothetical protein [Flavobacteriaceae bacterium]
MKILEFINHPLIVNNILTINKNVKQFEIEFKDFIIDRNVNIKTFQIYKLNNKIEVTFYKRKLYQIKVDTINEKIFYKDIILYFENFIEKSNNIEGQKNILLSNNIELVFDDITLKLEKAIYTEPQGIVS